MSKREGIQPLEPDSDIESVDSIVVYVVAVWPVRLALGLPRSADCCPDKRVVSGIDCLVADI